jgi:hypothetical protein
LVLADAVGVEIEALEVGEVVDAFEMFHAVVADVEYFEFGEFVDVGDACDLIFLHIELFECVFEWDETFVDVREFVGLNIDVITPKAICYRRTSGVRFLISVILFLPRNSDLMLATPSRFSISFILLEPSSSISNCGSSRFSIWFRAGVLS